MEKETFTVPNISCGHCVKAIRNELQEVAGVQHVDGDPEHKTVSVQWEAPASEEKIRSALKEMNYPAT